MLEHQRGLTPNVLGPFGVSEVIEDEELHMGDADRQ